MKRRHTPELDASPTQVRARKPHCWSLELVKCTMGYFRLEKSVDGNSILSRLCLFFTTAVAVLCVTGNDAKYGVREIATTKDISGVVPAWIAILSPARN